MVAHKNAYNLLDGAELRVARKRKANSPPHTHTTLIEILYLVEGEVEADIGGEHITIRRNDAVIIPENTMHSYRSTVPCRALLLLFNARFVQGLSGKYSDRELPTHLVANIPKKLQSQLFLLHNAFQESADSLIVHGHLLVVMGHLASLLNPAEEKAGSCNDLVQALFGYAQQNYSSAITVEDVSKALGLSKSQLSKLLNREIGLNFNDFINQYRIQKARHLLLSDMSITQVGYESGFESLRTFYRAFHKTFHTSPMKYRNSITGGVES